MSFLHEIRSRIGYYLMNKGIASLERNRKLININSAGSVGILFELKDDAIYYGIQKYFQKLQENKIRVKALGFTSNKHITSQFLPVLSFDFFDSRQVNWLNIPKIKCAQDFIDTDFDICINIASEDVFPLKYIAALSKSRLKVGAYGKAMPAIKYKELTTIYDIMFLAEDHHDQIVFLDQIHEYLTMLNPKKDA